jgi:hypothetical protein
MLRPAYLSKKLPRPLPTKDDGTLRTVLDARTYMLALPKARELRTQWQRACELLLAEADVAALSKAVELALFYDAKLDVRALDQDRQWWFSKYSREDRALIERVLADYPTLTAAEAIEHLEAAGM